MRAVQLSGARTLELAGGAYTPLAWHRLFDGDVYEAISALETGLVSTPPRLDTYKTLQLAYALAVTADKGAGRDTAPFDDWAMELGEVDTGLLTVECLAESRAGLFRREKQPEKVEEDKKKPKKG